MSVHIMCPACQKPLKVVEYLVGKKIKCPKCQQIITIPGGKPGVSVERQQPEPPTYQIICAGCGKTLTVDAAILDTPMQCDTCGTPIDINAYEPLVKLRDERKAQMKAARNTEKAAKRARAQADKARRAEEWAATIERQRQQDDSRAAQEAASQQWRKQAAEATAREAQEQANSAPPVTPPPIATPAGPKLTPCPDCGHEVSRKAKACPQCGSPFKTSPRVRSDVRHFHTKIVGVTFNNDDGSSRQKIIKRCAANEPLVFRHDSNNPHDPNTVQVLRTDDQQIGHLNADLAAEVVHESAKGALYTPFIANITGPRRRHGVNILIIVSGPETTPSELQSYVDNIGQGRQHQGSGQHHGSGCPRCGSVEIKQRRITIGAGWGLFIGGLVAAIFTFGTSLILCVIAVFLNANEARCKKCGWKWRV